MAEKAIQDGSAFEKFAAMVEAQGGDSSVLRDTAKFAKAPFSQEVLAPADGYIVKMNAEECGVTSVVLGAGRETKESSIDFSAGIMIHKKYGELVKKGEKIATLYTSKQELLAPAAKKYLDAIVIGAEQPAAIPLVFARVEKDRVEKY